MRHCLSFPLKEHMLEITSYARTHFLAWSGVYVHLEHWRQYLKGIYPRGNNKCYYKYSMFIIYVYVYVYVYAITAIVLE